MLIVIKSPHPITYCTDAPPIQAARVTYWCDQLQDLGPEIRGKVSAAYADAELLDLESLLSFLQNIKLRVCACMCAHVACVHVHSNFITCTCMCTCTCTHACVHVYMCVYMCGVLIGQTKFDPERWIYVGISTREKACMQLLPYRQQNAGQLEQGIRQDRCCHSFMRDISLSNHQHFAICK